MAKQISPPGLPFTTLRVLLVLVALLCSVQVWLWIRFQPSDIGQPAPVEATLEAISEAESREQDPHGHLRYQPEAPLLTKVLPPSTWTCTFEGDSSRGARKSRQCVVDHACLDDAGLFLLSGDQEPSPSQGTFPEINLMSSRDSADYFWQPRFRSMAGRPTKVIYKKETLFVYGLFIPSHFSHFLYDGMLPLFSTMQRFKGAKSSWLLRHAEYVGENTPGQVAWEMDAIVSGKELVLKPFEVVSPFQVMPPKVAPMCFERVVVGLGSQCGLQYCVHNTPTEVYKAYRDQIQAHYWPTPAHWNAFLTKRAKDTALAEGKPTDSTQGHKSPDKCIHTARYYNFLGTHSGLETKEQDSRQGVAHPEHAGLDPDDVDRSPVVAIVERYGTRSVLNMGAVIKGIVAQGLRLKVLNYDDGCGIPEVGYLMRDVNVLISTHGNALGGSLWMPSKPFPVVVSIDSTKYYESWFMWTTTVMAQRFTLHRCGPAHSLAAPHEQTCPFLRDEALAKASMAKVGLVLDPTTEQQDLITLTGQEFPIDLFEKYGAHLSQFLSEYWKNLPRYAEVDRLLGLLDSIRRDNVKDEQKSFLDICREGRCCGGECEGIMSRNVVGPLRAYGQDLTENGWGHYREQEGSTKEILTVWKETGVRIVG